MPTMKLSTQRLKNKSPKKEKIWAITSQTSNRRRGSGRVMSVNTITTGISSGACAQPRTAFCARAAMTMAIDNSTAMPKTTFCAVDIVNVWASVMATPLGRAGRAAGRRAGTATHGCGQVRVRRRAVPRTVRCR